MPVLPTITGAEPQDLYAFLMIFTRIGSMVMLMPGVGEMFVPARARLMIALAVAIAIAPSVMAFYPPMPAQPLAMAGLMFGEILIGLMLGMTARMIMSALPVAGSIIAMQTGLGFVQAVDPTFGAQGALIGAFLSLMAVTFLFASGAHELLFAAIAQSYVLFAPGLTPPIGDFASLVTETVASAFSLGVQIAAPFLVFGLVFNLGAGVLSKVMPQVQIFFIAMPANILLGLVMLMVTMGAGVLWFAEHFARAMAPFLG